MNENINTDTKKPKNEQLQQFNNSFEGYDELFNILKKEFNSENNNITIEKIKVLANMLVLANIYGTVIDNKDILVILNQTNNDDIKTKLAEYLDNQENNLLKDFDNNKNNLLSFIGEIGGILSRAIDRSYEIGAEFEGKIFHNISVNINLLEEIINNTLSFVKLQEIKDILENLKRTINRLEEIPNSNSPFSRVKNDIQENSYKIINNLENSIDKLMNTVDIESNKIQELKTANLKLPPGELLFELTE